MDYEAIIVIVATVRVRLSTPFESITVDEINWSQISPVYKT